MKEQTSLYFSEAGSDKEYHAQIIASGDGYVVNFQYGRRGSALKPGTKTAAPLPYEAAKKTYDKLVKEKTSKGYTYDESGAAFQGTENAGNKTDFVPQLLNSISESEAMRLISDDEWVAQEKKDGERRAVHADAVQVIGINRKGLSVPLPQAIADEMLVISKRTGVIRMDGEIIGDILYVFDLHIVMGNSIYLSKGWYDRMLQAEAALIGFKNVQALNFAETTEEKRALWNKVKAAHGEGIVFKRRDCLAKEGRPNSGGDWLKFKFTESASCLVSAVHPTKRSVAIDLFDGGHLVDVGNVTIPSNHDIPAAGDVVEVEYLYAYKGGSLCQPVYHGKRMDIGHNACVLSQLKYKPDGAGSEEAE